MSDRASHFKGEPSSSFSLASHPNAGVDTWARKLPGDPRTLSAGEETEKHPGGGEEDGGSCFTTSNGNGGGRCRSGNFKVLSVRKNGAEGSMCANKNKKMKKKEKKTLRRGSVHL